MWLLILVLLSITVTFSSTKASTLQEPNLQVTLSNVHDTLPDSLIEVNLEITWSDSPGTLSIDGFRFTIAYTSSVLQLDTITYNGLDSNECGWFFGFLLDSLADSGTPDLALELVGENTSQTNCFTSGTRTITLRFNVTDDISLYDTTNLDFYWRDCHDNIIWTGDPDTVIIALHVFNGEGDEITNENLPLPSFAGPDSLCFDPVSHGGSEVTRAIRFQSVKIEFSQTDVVEPPLDEKNLPATYILEQNYPNPFNPSTTIEFYLAERANWRVAIINLQGQIVTEFGGSGGPGHIALHWDSRDKQNHAVSSGIYFYRLTAGEYRTTRKMLLLK